ncbi:MAG: SPFH domain-containing protein [bacterium]|nr:SPFH domain-containing protein [bacterium]
MAVFVIIGTIMSFQLFEHLDAEDLMVIQSPWSGTLTWHTNPGVKGQWFGKVTKYRKRDQFWFSAKSDQGKKAKESLQVRFNDGAHATISGSIAWEMPVDDKSLRALHVRYGSHDAIQQQLVRTVIEKAVYMTGPLMSSKESYAEKRNELLRLMEDQVQRGVYRTETVQERQPDPMTGQSRVVNVVKLVLGKDGQVLRQETSPLEEFGVKTFNLSINEIEYDPEIEKQIQLQQQATMQVQLAVAKAKEAEQETITVAKKGEADAARAKWEQEVIKARQVTEAQQKFEVAKLGAQQQLEVARLDAQAAEQFKLAETLRGQGEAARRHLVMEADGALEKKLATYERVSQFYATAIQNFKGNWVPSVVMGNNSSHVAGSGAQELIDLLTVKTAKELGLSLNVPTGQ